MRRSGRYQPKGARRNQSPNQQPSPSFRQNTTSRAAENPPATSPNADEYLAILNEALKEGGPLVEEDADHNAENEDNEVYCTCRRKQNVRSSKKMYMCDDLQYDIRWYHDICLSPWEKEMVPKAKEWICSLCFDRRRARRHTAVAAFGNLSIAPPPPLAANGRGRGRGKSGVDDTVTGVSAMEAAARGVPGPICSQKEPIDQLAQLEVVKTRVAEKYKVAKDKDSPRWQPNSELSFEQKTIKVDNLHEKRNTWFWYGKTPDDTIVDTETGPSKVNAHLATFVDTETGFERVLPQVGGDQVSHEFASDEQEQKRVSLEAAARRVTNLFTRVEKGRGVKGLPIFKYTHSKSLGDRELTGPIVIFSCDSLRSKSTEVRVPIRLLASLPKAFELLAETNIRDPSEDEVVGHMTLPNIERPVADHVVEYLKGGELEVRALDKMAKSIDVRTLSRLVQMSSMGHLLDIEELQRPAMHALWHFLVLYKHRVSPEKLRKERKRTFPGCPANLILDACLQRQNLQDAGPLRLKIPLGRFTSTGFSLAKKVVKTASSPLVDWKWEQLTPVMWREICKKRQLGELWRTLGPLVKTRRSFAKQRLRITNADPFWRPGGARGALLGNHLPPEWPRKSKKVLEDEKQQLLDAEKEPMSNCRRLTKKGTPAMIVAPPESAAEEMPSTGAIESRSARQAIALVVDSASKFDTLENQKANDPEEAIRVRGSAGAQAAPEAVAVDDDFFEISKEVWELHQPSQQKRSTASGGVLQHKVTGGHQPAGPSTRKAPKLGTRTASTLFLENSNPAIHAENGNREGNYRGDRRDFVVDTTIMSYLSHIVRQVQEARVVPSFAGIDIMTEVMGSRGMTAIALTKFSEKYWRAMNKQQANIYVGEDLKAEGIIWTAQHLNVLCRNAGKPSKDVPLDGTIHALDALEVANVLQISRVQVYLLEWLRGRASKAS